jgi:hypothetical protein
MLGAWRVKNTVCGGSGHAGTCGKTAGAGAHAIAAGYELHFACAAGYSQFFPTGSMQYWPLHSISSAQFLGALAAGKPVYDVATLQTYVEEDRRLLERCGRTW